MPRRKKPMIPLDTLNAAEFRGALLHAAEVFRERMAEAKSARYERLMRPPEAAAYLGVSEKQLWHWRRWQCGPSYYRAGPNCVAYLQSDLDAFRQKWRVEPANPPPKGA